MKKIFVTLLIFLVSLSISFASMKVDSVTNNVYTKTTYSNNQGYMTVREIPYTGSTNYTTSFYIPGNEGTIRYYDRTKKQWIEKSINDGVLPPNATVHVITDKYNMILGSGYTYNHLAEGSISSANTAVRTIRKEGPNLLVTYKYQIAVKQTAVFWAVGSTLLLVDFSNEVQSFIWSGYDLDTVARLSSDGYYYKTPSNYLPYDKKYMSYWRIPSNYVANAFIKTGGSLAADIMGNAMLMMSQETINSEGFIPTLPTSSWLSKDYNIKGDFFDTRFNSDTIEVFLLAYQKYEEPSYRASYLKMAEYYLNHTTNHSFKNKTDNLEGILVEDYFKQGGKITHSSLNHQIQAAHMFYKLYEQEDDVRYLNTANLMIQGVKNTLSKWIMKDGNLEYAYMPNGSMGLQDYPYLTYNDLLIVQKDILALNGSKDLDLAKLIASKKTWMDRYGIKDYNKWD